MCGLLEFYEENKEQEMIQTQQLCTAMRPTSREAFDYILATGILAKQQGMVYRAVFAFGPITGRELNRDLDGTSYHKRLSELEQMGVIREDGVKACSVTGRKAVGWVVNSEPPQMQEKGEEMGKSGLEATFMWACQQAGLPEPEREVMFAKEKGRRWRLDFVFPGKIGVEIDGGVWTRGRHSRGKGMAGDADKGNMALMLGWRILHFTTVQMKRPMECAEMVKELLDSNPIP